MLLCPLRPPRRAVLCPAVLCCPHPQLPVIEDLYGYQSGDLAEVNNANNNIAMQVGS